MTSALSRFRRHIVGLALAFGIVAGASNSAHAQAMVKQRDVVTGKSRAADVSPDDIFVTNSPAATVFATAARTVTANSTDQLNYAGKGMVCTLDITAASGTSPTLDVKIQIQDTVASKYTDLGGAAFAQKTGTGTSILTIYPGVAETANVDISDPLPRNWRAVATIGGTTPSFTFSLACQYIQ